MWHSVVVILNSDRIITKNMIVVLNFLKLKIEGNEYDHYVICTPGESKIVFDSLFSGMDEMRDRIETFN